MVSLSVGNHELLCRLLEGSRGSENTHFVSANMVEVLSSKFSSWIMAQFELKFS